MAYAADQLIDNGVATNEAEAAAIVLSDLLSYVNGSPVQPTTAGDLLTCLGQFVATNENSPLVQSLLDTIVEAISANEDLAEAVEVLPTAYGHDDYDQVAIQNDDQIMVQSENDHSCWLMTS